MSWESFSAFIRDECQVHPTLACPVRVLWGAYNSYCTEWGFEASEAHQFISYLLLEEGVRISAGGKGRLKRFANGIGLASMSARKTG